jgi:hypothetical protein
MSDAPFNLPSVVERFIAALNANDEAALLATLSDDVFINDVRREFWGKPAVTAFARKELLGPKVTMEVISARSHYGLVAVDTKVDGEYDKSGLPDPLILTSYFVVEGDAIATLIIIQNRPA